MISIDQLDATYDRTAVNQDPPVKVPKATARPAVDISAVDNPVAPTVDFGAAKPVDVQEYGKYLTNGVYADTDIDNQRGQKQSILEKTGRMIGNLPGNIIGSLLEGIGDFGMLGIERGDDRNYSNALTEAGKSLQNLTGDLYNRNDHSTFGSTIADPTWWIDQVGILTQFGVSYGLLGAGVGITMGKLASGAAKLFQSGAAGTRALAAAGQLGSAGLMAYTMGAQSAGNVFHETYDTQFKSLINQGLTPEEAGERAKHVAAQSAATTAQLTTAIGTVLGLSGLSPYFQKSEQTVQNIFKKAVPLLEGETTEAWANRIRALDPETYKAILNPSGSVAKKLTDAGKMGVEMMQLGFGEKTGHELGREGKVKEFMDQFGELEHFFDRTMDKDGALAFIAGAAGGMATHYVTHNLLKTKRADVIDPSTGQPITDEATDAPQTAWMTPRAFSEMHTRPRFTKLRDTIAQDIDSYDKLQKSYMAAVTAKDPVAIDRATNALFDVNNLNAITTGQGKMWRDTYEDIANLPVEIAQQRGYSEDYKEKAAKAMSQIDRYQKIYDDLNKRYGTEYQTNEGLQSVVDGIFSRKAQLDTWDKTLAEHEAKLKELTKDSDKNLQISDPETYINDATEHFRRYSEAKDVIDKITKDHNTLNKLSEDFNAQLRTGVVSTAVENKLRALAREYSAVDPNQDGSQESLSKAVERTKEQMQQTINRHVEKVQESDLQMQNSSGFIKYQSTHPDAKFNEYRDGAVKNLEHTTYGKQIANERAKYDIANQNLAEIVKEKSLARFAKKASDYFETERNRQESLDREYERQLTERAKDKTVKDKAEKEASNLVGHQANLKKNEAIDLLNRINTELSTATGEQRTKLLKERADAKVAVEHFSEVEVKNTVDTSTPSEPVTVESLLNTNDQSITSDDIMVDPVDEFYTQLSPAMDLKYDDTVIPDTKKAVAIATVEEHIRILTDAENKVFEHLFNYPEIVDKVTQLKDQLLSGDVGFSYHSLDAVLKDGNKAAQIMADLKDYVDAIQNYNAKEDLIEGDKRTTIDSPGYDIVGVDRPEDLPIADVHDYPDDVAFSAPTEGAEVSFAGRKTVNANSFANMTLGYKELSPDHNNEIQMASVKEALNSKTSLMVLKPGFLTPGTDIRLEVDTEYDGKKSSYGEERNSKTKEREQFSDYLDKSGKIMPTSRGDVPIKIVDAKTGEKIGYVRTHSWVTERRTDDKTGLRNIAEIYDDNGNEINGAAQARNILDIRLAVVDQWNANGGHVTGKTTSKSVGNIILNNDIDTKTEKSKIIPGYAFNHTDGGLLPDPKIRITIAQGGTFYSAKGYQFDKPIAPSGSYLPDGTIYAMLPGANGEHHAAPLVGKGLGDSPVALRTIVRALELHLKYSGVSEDPVTKEVSKLRDNTRHDVSATKGLKDFIEQYYTHTNDFQDAVTVHRLDSKHASKFQFAIKEPIPGKEDKATIKIGWVNSGKEPMVAKLDALGNLDPNFVNELRKGLETRQRAVVFTRGNLRGINEQRSPNNPFKDAIYTSKGTWSHKEYNDYNEYVKAFSRTTAYGKNKLSDGSYVYVANPAIEYVADTPERTGSTNLVDSNKTATKVEFTEPSKHADADAFDDMFSLKSRTVIRKELGTPDEKSKPLDMKNLTDLYNFTPEAQRNGKVPEEVLRDLTSRGHTGLADGYNPFSLCL